MSKDAIAYAVVKALVSIIKNSETKQEAAETLATLQGGSDLQSMMQTLPGYESLKG